MSPILRIFPSGQTPDASTNEMATKEEVDGWGNEGRYRTWSGDKTKGSGKYGEPKPLGSEGSCVECIDSVVGDWDLEGGETLISMEDRRDPSEVSCGIGDTPRI